MTVPSFLGAGDFTYRGHEVPRFVEASGSLLVDDRGSVYLDGEAANGAAVLGYDRTVLDEALGVAAKMPALPSFCESTLRLDVARRLEERVSAAVGVPGRVSFELGGAQGMELAMKVVAANRGWRQVVVLDGGYHGRSPFTATLSASPRYREALPVAGAEVVRLPHPGPEYGGLEPDEWLRYVRALGGPHSGVARSKVSAIVVEPMLNVGGMTLPASGLLDVAAEHFRSEGALLVVDEIFTGFHRIGPVFGFERHGLRPDIVVLSKALTNGVGALSAVWAREPLMDAEHFAPGTHSSTFAGTPFMLGVADVVLRRMEDEAVWRARVARLEARLQTIVDRAVARVPDLVVCGEAFGGVARLRLRDTAAWRVRDQALSPAEGRDDGLAGLLLASTGMAPDVIAVHPPLTIGEKELDLLEGRLIDALIATAGVPA